MILIFLMIIIFSIIIPKKKIGMCINPLSIYVLFWFFCFLLAKINILDMYSVSEKTFLLILINVLMFSLGYLIFLKRKSNSKIGKFNIKLEYNKLEKFILIISFIILFYYFIRYNSIAKLLQPDQLRNIKFQYGYLFKNQIEVLFYNNIITSLMYIMLLKSIVLYMFYHIKNKWIIITVINTIIYSFTGYGRMIYFEIFLFILFAILYKKIACGNNRNNKIKVGITSILMMLIIGISLMVYLTAIRRGIKIDSITDFFENFKILFNQFISYFTGPINSLDYAITSKAYEQFPIGMGRASLGGIEYFIDLLLNAFSIPYNSLIDQIGIFTNAPIHIGYNSVFNAFYTAIFNLYIDGRVFGVIIGSFTYGALYAVTLNKFLEKKTLYRAMLLVFLSYTTIASTYRMSFSLSSSIIVIIVLIILIKLDKDKSKLA